MMLVSRTTRSRGTRTALGPGGLQFLVDQTHGRILVEVAATPDPVHEHAQICRPQRGAYGPIATASTEAARGGFSAVGTPAPTTRATLCGGH